MIDLRALYARHPIRFYGRDHRSRVNSEVSATWARAGYNQLIDILHADDCAQIVVIGHGVSSDLVLKVVTVHEEVVRVAMRDQQ